MLESKHSLGLNIYSSTDDIIKRLFKLFSSAITIFVFVVTKSYSQTNQFEYEDITSRLIKNSETTSQEIFDAAWLNYQAGDYTKSLELLSKISLEKDLPDNVYELSSLVYLKQNELALAEDYWNQGLSSQDIAWFRYAPRVDQTAINISYIIPGGGLIYEGLIGYGLASFVINGILISSMFNAISHSQYGLAFLYLFLELPFYKGNINATKEFVRKKSLQDFEMQKNNWILKAEELINLRYDY